MSAATASFAIDVAQARQHFDALQRPGDIREVRVLGHVPASGFGGPATTAGYFNDGEALARELQSIGSAEGVYITQNPADPDLLARACNRLKRKPKHTTADSDISRYQHLTVDVDPRRKAGISATDAELAQALSVRDAVVEFVTVELGWERPLVSMMSGNGGQATWRIGLPADEGGRRLVEDVLSALADLFGTADVSIDTTLSNPSRIVKVAGTIAAKGDSLPHRPHRMAHATFCPETGFVSEAQLRALVALSPKSTAAQDDRGRTLVAAGSGSGSHDVSALLRVAGVGATEHERGEYTVHRLDRCLTSNDHNDGAAILQFRSGAVAYRCHHNSCAGKGWQDARPALGLPVARNGHDPAASVSFGSDAIAQKTDARDWPSRLPLPAMAPTAPSMTPDLVPEPLRPWICDIADRSRLPIEMATAPAVVASGSLIGRGVGIRPGTHDNFVAVPNLWGALVARPGWMKTGMVKEAFRPLGRLAAEAHEAYVAAEEALESTRERIEAEIDAIKRKMREAAKRGQDLSGLEGDLREKRTELKETKITERRFFTHDATVEKLGELLRDNPRGMLVQRDELAGWLRGLEKAGREGDREFFLEGWNGTGSFTTDRIGRGTIYIPALTLSVFGGIQPGKIGPLVSSAVDGGAGDDGLVQRLQILVWPDKLPPWSKPARWPDAAAADRGGAIFEALAKMDSPSVGAIDADIPFLCFSPGAQQSADAWRDALEHRLRSGELDDTPAFASHVAKYRSLMPALSLMFFLIDRAAGVPGIVHGVVGESHVALAKQWCAFLEAHARKLYAAELHAGASAAHALAAKIEAGAVFDQQSVRDIYRAQWAGLRSPERVLAGLNELTDLGWLRVDYVQAGGRPSQIVRLHPDLMETEKTRRDSTDRTDKTPSVSSVSASSFGFERIGVGATP